jgi:hypothetical protein
MIGISDIPPPPPSPPADSSPGSASPDFDARSRSMRFLKLSRAMASIPNVANSLRRMSYGGRSPCSSSSTCGRISSSTNRFTASRIIWCSSLHWNIACPPRVSNRRVDRRDGWERSPNGFGGGCHYDRAHVAVGDRHRIHRSHRAQGHRCSRRVGVADDLLREHADAADRRSRRDGLRRWRCSSAVPARSTG